MSFGFTIPLAGKEPISGNKRRGRFDNARGTALGRWSAKVAHYARLAGAGSRTETIAGPARVSVWVWYPRPSRAAVRARERKFGVDLKGKPFRKTNPPDADNLMKPIFDGLTAAGVVKDDALIEPVEFVRAYLPIEGLPGFVCVSVEPASLVVEGSED